MRKTFTFIFVLAISLLTIVTSAQAQVAQSSALGAVAGHYEGIIKTSALGDVPVKLDLRVVDEKLSGGLQTPFGEVNVIGGSLAQGRLTIQMEVNGDEAKFTGQLSGDRLTGDFNGFGQAGTVDVKRTGDAPPAPDTRVHLSLPKAAWREDLRFLASEIPKRHKNAFHRVTREQFERAVAELDAQITALDDDRIVLGLARIAAMIGDGHTTVNWHWSYRAVPLNLFWFGTELRVTSTIAPYRRALGARVVRVGGVSLSEAFKRAQPYIAQGENEWFVKGRSAGSLTYPALLYAMGLAPDARQASYTFEDARGKRFTLDMRAREPRVGQGARDYRWLDAARETPLYRQRMSEPLWCTYLPQSQTVYFNFKGYPSRDAFKKFALDLFTFIDRNPVKRLVVDMRQNGGGDFTRGREYIIPGIKQREAINRRGHLFVVTGRWTYSAGMTNATDFRKETNAILVGEPTGGRPNGYQENREFRLPNSHLNVWVSTQFYEFQKTETPAVMPDQRIDPDWASYLRGRDPVLEWIEKQR